MIGSALVLTSLLLPVLAKAQGLRSGGAAVSLLVTKLPPGETAIRDVEFPLTWSGTPTRVTVCVSGENTGDALLFVRDRRGRLERAAEDGVEVQPLLLRIRVVQRGDTLLPPGRWHLEVRAEELAAGLVVVVNHTVNVR